MTEEEILQHLQELLTPRRRQLFEQVLTNRTNFFTVATQDVYQLHNTSAVIRSCDVFGIQNIHVIEERMPKRIDKEIAMGAQKWVDVQRYSATKDCLHTLRKKGYRIVATSPHEDAVMLDDFDISTPAAFFFGTEREGLSQEILEEADSTLKIPMVGFTESLNISVSAAIILQSVTEKMRRSNLPWRLSAAEKFQIELAWTKKTIKNSDQIIERFHNS
ncbi:TrmH family RNA methyltransferase [Christiangramia flava]|uniref:tRNA (guanosine(18)-2'-O)-methyltransferase n=1 Tax=Christiangramia flava JLT2011 TaxID=1229726 RepID=A0A1L7I7X4_9FLAO|nr:RNA methyltransferase [Christiangramia flava]APU69699.1 tRNA (guanosine(18)-2'-O)-methyltransferase [Christiangramia flava JLT2011]